MDNRGDRSGLVMISIQYRGQSDVCSGFANRLGQYAVGKIISKKTNYFLWASKPGNFDDTYDQNNSVVVTDNDLVISGEPGILLDYEEISRHNGRICLHGFFQNYENFRPYKDDIRKIYSFKKNPKFYNDDLIAVHIRLGEYRRDNNNLPIDYYLNVIKDSKKIPVIYTDEPKSEYINEISKYLKCEVVCNSEWQDFVDISSYKTIAISQSSYSWWASWLSEAETVYYPYTPKNYWQHRNDGRDINLVVTDENRFILV